jgi:hypothetical protein
MREENIENNDGSEIERIASEDVQDSIRAYANNGCQLSGK